jgi:hypothetical protein
VVELLAYSFNEPEVVPVAAMEYSAYPDIVNEEYEVP